MQLLWFKKFKNTSVYSSKEQPSI